MGPHQSGATICEDRHRRRQVWKAYMRSTREQLPERGSSDEKVLRQLAELLPEQFEAVIVALFREMRSVEHSITQTRYVNDEGVNFFGTFYASSHSLRGT